MNWQCCHCHCRESCCRVSRYSLRHAFTEMNDYFEEVLNELVCCGMLCLYHRYFRNSADEARINHSSLNKIVELVDVIPVVIMVLLDEVDPVSHARNPSKFVPITTKSCRTIQLLFLRTSQNKNVKKMKSLSDFIFVRSRWVRR